jgi:hypothetical protein
MCRLVGSTLGEAANGSYSRVMEIFPTFKEVRCGACPLACTSPLQNSSTK